MSEETRQSSTPLGPIDQAVWDELIRIERQKGPNE